MAVKSRIFGRDVQIRIARGGAPETTLTAIKNFTFETRQRIVSEGYLGETGLRQDSIFDEVGGSFTLHPEDPAAMVFQKAIADKAIRRSATEEQISIVFRSTYPSGQVVKVTIPEVEFDPVPFTVGGRDTYVELGFTYKAEKYSLAA